MTVMVLSSSLPVLSAAKAGAAAATAISERVEVRIRVFIWSSKHNGLAVTRGSSPAPGTPRPRTDNGDRSEEHTSELQSLMRISYAVFCLKKKKNNIMTK